MDFQVELAVLVTAQVSMSSTLPLAPEAVWFIHRSCRELYNDHQRDYYQDNVTRLIALATKYIENERAEVE